MIEQLLGWIIFSVLISLSITWFDYLMKNQTQHEVKWNAYFDNGQILAVPLALCVGLIGEIFLIEKPLNPPVIIAGGSCLITTFFCACFYSITSYLETAENPKNKKALLQITNLQMLFIISLLTSFICKLIIIDHQM